MWYLNHYQKMKNNQQTPYFFVHNKTTATRAAVFDDIVYKMVWWNNILDNTHIASNNYKETQSTFLCLYWDLEFGMNLPSYMKNVANEDEILAIVLFKVCVNIYMEIFLGKHFEHSLVTLFFEEFLFLLYCIFL
jgi:hypothetical protein